MWLISRFLCIQNPVMLLYVGFVWRRFPCLRLTYICLLTFSLFLTDAYSIIFLLTFIHFFSFWFSLPFSFNPFFSFSRFIFLLFSIYLSLFFLLSLCVSSHSLFLCVVSLRLFLSWLCICLHMKSYMYCVYVHKAGCVSVCAYFTQVSQIFEINVFSFLWNIVKFGLFFFFLLWGKSPVI